MNAEDIPPGWELAPDQPADYTLYKVGRPTKYIAFYGEMLVFWMEQGNSFVSIAQQLNVTRATLYNWLKEHEEFREAKDLGESAALLFHERTLIQYIRTPRPSRSKSRAKERKINYRVMSYVLSKFHRADWTRQHTYEADTKLENCPWCNPKSPHYQNHNHQASMQT
jgi:transposase-like protein